MISKTGLAWIGGMGLLLVMGVVHPVYPFMAYLLDYFQHPPLRWWGDELPDLRWSLTPALVWLASCLLHGQSPFGGEAFRHAQTKLLAAYVALAFVVTIYAVAPDRSLDYATTLARLLLLHLLIVATIRSHRHFRWIVLALMIGGFTWGWDAWRDPTREAGRLQNIGGPDSRNDNQAAAALLPILPFTLIYLFSGDRKERLAGLVAAPFVANTIILCNSRASTVAMAAAGATAVLITKGPLRKRVAGLLVVSAIGYVALADPEFIERQMTLFSGEQDGSTTGRLVAWRGAMRVIAAYPLGAGGGGFDALSPRFVPELTDLYDGAERGVHNTFLNIATDYSVLGLLLFAAAIGVTFLELQRVRLASTDQRLQLDALGLQLGLVAFAGAAFFVNRVYAEIFFWLPALGAALASIHDRQALVPPDVAPGEDGAAIDPAPADARPEDGPPPCDQPS